VRYALGALLGAGLFTQRAALATGGASSGTGAFLGYRSLTTAATIAGSQVILRAAGILTGMIFEIDHTLAQQLQAASRSSAKHQSWFPAILSWWGKLRIQAATLTSAERFPRRSRSTEQARH